jgi:hypothetical protein
MTPDEYWADSDLPTDCLRWVKQVDAIMKRDWFIDTSDAGLSEDDILRYWRGGETPDDFVARFAEKYGLIGKEQWEPFGTSGRVS